MPAAPRTATALSYPVLVADIGGTNARFALIADAEAEILIFPTVPTADSPDPTTAIEKLLAIHAGARPNTAVMAIAGPITGDSVHLTNCPWVVRPKEMIARLGLRDVILLNDFEAQALALPSLTPDDLLQIGGGAMLPNAAKVVLGPGTGLGVASLVYAVDMWIPVPGEGGHVTLGPETDRDRQIWPHLERVGGRITAEVVLSGPGIPRLYRAVCAADGVVAGFETPGEITDAALSGDPLAAETLDLFATYLGRVAGDFALTSLARGGVYLAGGVSLKIEHFLTAGGFRAAFEDKAPHQALVAKVPTFLITHPRPALVGLAAFARQPGLFGVELAGRRWQV